MKCKRCGYEMRRIKDGAHGFKYVCPKCGLVIGGKAKQPVENKDDTQ